MAQYTLIVGTRNWSSWSLRPYVALRAAGAAFETVDIRLRALEDRMTHLEANQDQLIVKAQAAASAASTAVAGAVPSR